MSGEPTSIAFEGLLTESTAGDPLAIASSGFLIGGDGGPFFGVEIDEVTVRIALVDERRVEL